MLKYHYVVCCHSFNYNPMARELVALCISLIGDVQCRSIISCRTSGDFFFNASHMHGLIVAL